MLNRLTAKSNSFPVIQLAKHASGYVYGLHSVNMLVGPSGSGKTRLMNDIIHQLCGSKKEDLFYVDGETHGMSVIYYTASPLHKGVPIEEKQGVPFVDASPAMFPLRSPNFNRTNQGSGSAILEHQLSALCEAIQMQREGGSTRFLLLIDNADMMLDVHQQRDYVHSLELALKEFMLDPEVDAIQLILSAHSPLIASDIFKGSITRLGQDAANDDKLEGFGGTIQSLYNYTFSTPSIGAVAERTIVKMRDDKEKSMPGWDIVKDEICDAFIKSYLTKP